MTHLTLATRKSPLAMRQTQLVADFLGPLLPGTEFVIEPFITTGDKRQQWSLEKEGGKGLFTKELEIALCEGRAHLAVHSAKDLPTELEEGTCIVGYLPREQTNDVMIRRRDVEQPKVIATSSPRRRSQIGRLYPQAEWITIRGNVETRLNKIINGEADATILAAAGLRRLGITFWEGLEFSEFTLQEVVPAPGQGAIALQGTPEIKKLIAPHLCRETEIAVTLERTFLRLLGGGCQSAFAAHYNRGIFQAFHETTGYFEEPIPFRNYEEATAQLEQVIKNRIHP